MQIINSLSSLFNLYRLNKINIIKKNPLDVQNSVFFELLDKAKDTEWGKKYNYSSINTISEYQERVPLNDYDSLKIYIDRQMHGEKNILWSSEVKWYAKSSGTTSDKSKFIPVSEESLKDCHFKGMRDVFAIYCENFPNNHLLEGKTLTLGGSHKVSSFNDKVFVGDLSAILMQNTSSLTELKRTPPLNVALIPDFEEKVEKIIELSINENITAITGVPSWYLVLLKRVLEATGKNNISEVWPNLEIFVHGGINFGPYREIYKQIIPSEKMHYLETYNASEGFFAISDDKDRNDMLLMLDYGIFYEFIPMDEFHKENKNVVTLKDVEIGKNYAIVISTNGGLWRYIIGDTVTFTTTYPFRIKITGRTKHFINVFGEEIIIDNAENALKVACEKTGALVSEYTAAPIFMDEKTKGSHEWLIEFSKVPDDFELFLTTLDESLQSYNSDYEAKRFKDATLKRPTLTVAKSGLFYEWMKNRNKVGGQNKIPRLANSREYIEELLKLQN